MILKKTVYSVMIISASDTFTNAIKELLPSHEFAPVVCVNGINAAKRMLNQRAFDFVLINSPLLSETGTKFACKMCTSTSTVVLLFTKADMFAQIYEEVTPFGVFTLQKPVSDKAVLTALLWMVAARERLRQSAQKEITFEEKMREIRLVNRAKWLLIENRRFAEADAHKYIEKTAMDRCVPKSDIAEEIIAEYT